MTANFPEKNLYVSKTGLEFLCHNMHETVQTDVEVFQEQSYIRCGLWLDDDCCVIDVGSNIGFFSLFVADHFRNARIYCAEPAPESLRLLRANLARNGAPAVVWPYAISDRNGTATFKFYPRMAGNSGLYADEVEEARVTSAFLDNVAPGDTAFRDRVLEGKFDDAVSLTCETRTLSELIRSAGVGRIDLLKIDAEKAEHEVIAGIEDTIWEQIDQISMEAHEIGNRVEELCDLLRSRGFTTEVETHKYLEGTGIVQIYASKRELRLDWQLPAGRLLPGNPLARPMQSS